MFLSKNDIFLVEENSYNAWRGDAWPSFQDVLLGVEVPDEIYNEITQTIKDHEWQIPTKVISNLEMMVTYGCTLKCASCTNFSDYQNHSRGNVRWKDTRLHLKRLLEHKVKVEKLLLMGGEPFLNKDFPNWIDGLRTEFPDIKLMILTNGHLVMRNKWIIDSMRKYGNIWLKFSNHMPGAEWFEDSVELIKNNFDWEVDPKPFDDDYLQFQDELIVYKDNNGNKFEIANYDTYQLMVKGTFGSLKPWKNEPAKAFARCMQPKQVAFNDGILFKCTMNWNLQHALANHNQADDKDWDGYIFNGVDVHDCTADQLNNFVQNIGKPNKICAMCPSDDQSDSETYIDHYATTTSKIKFLKYDKETGRNF